jgi:hypothetical protein
MFDLQTSPPFKSGPTRRGRPQIFRLGSAAGLSLILTLTPIAARAWQSGPYISTVDEIKAEFASVPCRDEDRFLATRALFEKLGVTASDLVEGQYKNVKNLVIRKAGASSETIVIGAHYDKVSAGCGAIDNWTGIVTVAYLYRSLRDVPTNKTFLFVAFGKEEQGLIGSHAMVRAIDKQQLGQYCEMINIDSLGLTSPGVLDNTSSAKLTKLAAATARDLKIPFAHAAIAGTDADSSSFKKRGIPALTIHGMSRDWSTVLHTNKDQAAKAIPLNVYLGYRIALELALRLDSSGCAAFEGVSRSASRPGCIIHEASRPIRNVRLRSQATE